MSLALLLTASLASAGCPELNQQPEKATNPLFSVYDPAGRGRVSAPTVDARSGTPVIKTQGVAPDDVVR
jgi:hypothetical protein